MNFNLAIQHFKGRTQVNSDIMEIIRAQKVNVYDIIDIIDVEDTERLWNYPLGVGFTLVQCQGSVVSYMKLKKAFHVDRVVRFNKEIKTLVV